MRSIALLACLVVSGCALSHERETAGSASCVGLSHPTHTLGPPAQHHATSPDCPSERGPIAPSPACDVASDPTCPDARCVTDADCTDGPNGRCSHLHRGPASIRLFCTYDECARDEDCATGPCVCRSSSDSAAANDCFDTGNCRLDADCGPGGFCSPSLVGDGFCACPTEDLCTDAGPGTGCTVSIDGGTPTPTPCVCGDTCAAPGFYCHTPCDECTNDGDCETGRCLYDRREERWACRAPICTSGP